MKKLIVTLVALSLAIPVSGFAQWGMMDHGGKGKWKAKRHHRSMNRRMADPIGRLLKGADEIGLTGEQVAKLKDMRVQFKLNAIEQQAEIQKANVELGALLSDPDSPESKVFAAIDRVAGLRAEMHKARFSAQREIRTILTDEQKEKIKGMKKEARKERKEKKEKRHFRGRSVYRGGGG